MSSCSVCGGLIQRWNDNWRHVTGIGTPITKSHDPVRKRWEPVFNPA